MSATPHPLAELVSLLESMPEPYIVFDLQYRILAANAAYRARCDDVQDVVGRRCYEVSHHYTLPCDQAGESCPFKRGLASGQRERVLHLHHTPCGEEYVNIELTPIRNGSGEINYVVEKMEALNATGRLSVNHDMVGCSAPFQRVLELISRVAKSEATVLLEGESGTGKELVAQALHAASRRASGPFVVVDCSGIPESLFESELFGHERGAFTGANARRAGLVESVSGGTLFLDEVGDIPLSMQVKLLRLLETGTYRSVGSTELRRADLRVVSATHQPLRAMVEKGSFRADLYYRLNTFPIYVPALRERREDLPLLVESLLARVAPTSHLRISGAVMARLTAYDYPGNVRELRNLLERASLMCDHDKIDLADLPPELQSTTATHANAISTADTQNDQIGTKRLEATLAAHTGPRRLLARKLGISERTLYRRLRALAPAP